MSRLGLWFPVTAPPLVWGAQGLLGWWLAAYACRGEAGLIGTASVGGARVGIAVVTVLAIVTTIAAGVAAGACWRERTANGRAPIVRERSEFLALVGLLMATALTLGLVWAGLPSLIVRACGETR